MERRILSFEARFEIGEFLKTVTTVNGDFAEYHDGWSEQRVAEHFKCTVHNVAEIRKRLIGNLKPAHNVHYTSELRESVNALNEAVLQLDERVKRIEARLSKWINLKG